MSEFTHLDHKGQAHMVDVGDKPSSRRRAEASGMIRMQPETLAMIVDGSHKKGDVLAAARIAGIMASKRTSELIPLCHPIAITKVSVELEAETESNAIRCTATVETVGPTGVEIEALMSTQVALLTVYDMCKAVDRGMTIESVQLDDKSGGRSGHWQRDSRS